MVLSKPDYWRLGEFNTFSFSQAPSGLPVSQTRHRKLGSPAKSSGPFWDPKPGQKTVPFKLGLPSKITLESGIQKHAEYSPFKS